MRNKDKGPGSVPAESKKADTFTITNSKTGQTEIVQKPDDKVEIHYAISAEGIVDILDLGKGVALGDPSIEIKVLRVYTIQITKDKTEAVGSNLYPSVRGLDGKTVEGGISWKMETALEWCRREAMKALRYDDHQFRDIYPMRQRVKALIASEIDKANLEPVVTFAPFEPERLGALYQTLVRKHFAGVEDDQCIGFAWRSAASHDPWASGKDNQNQPILVMAKAQKLSAINGAMLEPFFGWRPDVMITVCADWWANAKDQERLAGLHRALSSLAYTEPNKDGKTKLFIAKPGVSQFAETVELFGTAATGTDMLTLSAIKGAKKHGERILEQLELPGLEAAREESIKTGSKLRRGTRGISVIEHPDGTERFVADTILDSAIAKGNLTVDGEGIIGLGTTEEVMNLAEVKEAVANLVEAAEKCGGGSIEAGGVKVNLGDPKLRENVKKAKAAAARKSGAGARA